MKGDLLRVPHGMVIEIIKKGKSNMEEAIDKRAFKDHVRHINILKMFTEVNFWMESLVERKPYQ